MTTKTKQAPPSRGKKKMTRDEKFWEKRSAHIAKSTAEYRYPFFMLNIVELFRR